jgi:hypothetical protein
MDKCKYCLVIITQCRCPAKDKTVFWKVCNTCKNKLANGEVLHDHGFDKCYDDSDKLTQNIVEDLKDDFVIPNNTKK